MEKAISLDGSHVIIAEKEAIDIATDEAFRMIRHFKKELFVAKAELRRDRWHVSFRLKCQDCVGGGPHFVIDRSGVVRKRTYTE